MNLDAVFFDVNGTISTSKYWEGLNNEYYNHIQNVLFESKSDVLTHWMRGIISSEDVCDWLSVETNIDYNVILQSLISSCRSFKVHSHALTSIRRAQKKYKVAIVTTNMDCFTRFVVPNCQIKWSLTNIFNSSDYGFMKEDGGELFKIAARIMNCSIKNTLLIDDSEKVCTIFEKEGGKSYKVISPQHLPLNIL